MLPDRLVSPQQTRSIDLGPRQHQHTTPVCHSNRACFDLVVHSYRMLVNILYSLVLINIATEWVS